MIIYLTIWCPVCWFKEEKYEFDTSMEPLLSSSQSVGERVHATMQPGCKGPVRVIQKRKHNQKETIL